MRNNLISIYTTGNYGNQNIIIVKVLKSVHNIDYL